MSTPGTRQAPASQPTSLLESELSARELQPESAVDSVWGGPWTQLEGVSLGVPILAPIGAHDALSLHILCWVDAVVLARACRLGDGASRVRALLKLPQSAIAEPLALW